MNQITTQQIVLIETPIRFHPKRLGTVRRDEMADIATALCRLAEGERRQGVIDLAIALGLVALERG